MRRTLTALFATVSYVMFSAVPSLAQDAIYYSPESNLEKIDIAMLDQAKQSIDIAMYAFTDKPIAYALARAADRGVRIRLYRDATQIRDKGDADGFLSRIQGIQIRIKSNNSYNIMHLKAYVIDGYLLREGSANWSPAGEGAWHKYYGRVHHDGVHQQDNDLFLTTDPRVVSAFRRTFDRLWERSSNEILKPILSQR